MLVGGCHIDEFGIAQTHGVYRIGIVASQIDAVGKSRQYRVDSHLVGSEVEKLLRTHRGKAEEHHQCGYDFFHVDFDNRVF